MYVLISQVLVMPPYAYLIYRWAVDHSLFKKPVDRYSAKEVYCLSYIAAMILVLLVACFIVLARFLTFSMLTMGTVESCFYIFSTTAFSIIVMVFPGRLNNVLLAETRQNLIITKSALIRFMSHEVRIDPYQFD